MKPGIELDILVAEKVMGLKVVETIYPNRHVGPITIYTIGAPDYYDEVGDTVLSNPVPKYSTRIKAAWEVVRSFEGRARVAITLTEMPTAYQCSIVYHLGMGNFEESSEHGDTAPHAICLAALKSFGIETEL